MHRSSRMVFTFTASAGIAGACIAAVGCGSIDPDSGNGRTTASESLRIAAAGNMPSDAGADTSMGGPDTGGGDGGEGDGGGSGGKDARSDAQCNYYGPVVIITSKPWDEQPLCPEPPPPAEPPDTFCAEVGGSQETIQMPPPGGNWVCWTTSQDCVPEPVEQQPTTVSCAGLQDGGTGQNCPPKTTPECQDYANEWQSEMNEFQSDLSEYLTDNANSNQDQQFLVVLQTIENPVEDSEEGVEKIDEKEMAIEQEIWNLTQIEIPKALCNMEGHFFQAGVDMAVWMQCNAQDAEKALGQTKFPCPDNQYPSGYSNGKITCSPLGDTSVCPTWNDNQCYCQYPKCETP